MIPLSFILAAAGCDSAKDVDDSALDSGAAAAVGLNPDDFLGDGLAADITTEACTLSSGTETTCYRVEVQGAPADHDVGPFCPRSIEDEADAAGIWIEGGETWDVDGDFIVGLADFYSDDNWQLYDLATGEVYVTDTEESCEAAARPDVDPEYQNHCVECALDYVDGGVTKTFLIPVEPVPLSSPAELGRMESVGVALNGVVYDPPAPTDAILGAYTIAAFDDCGGHVNLHNGYHYHAATGCPEAISQSDGHAARIGYALDGYAMHAMLNEDGSEPDDLDECRGHSDTARGYHYHVASAGENMFIGCLMGEAGSSL